MAKHSKKLNKQILNIFKENPQKQYNYKQISKILNITTQSQKRAVSRSLQQLAREGKLQEVKKGKYQLRFIKKKTTGILDMSQRRNAVVYSEELNADIHINVNNLNHAIHNDLVEVSIFAKSKKNILEGEITKIIKRSDTNFVGTIIKSDNFAFITVDNKLFPFDIFVPIKKLKGAKHGDKVIAKIVDWPEYAKKSYRRNT